VSGNWSVVTGMSISCKKLRRGAGCSRLLAAWRIIGVVLAVGVLAKLFSVLTGNERNRDITPIEVLDRAPLRRSCTVLFVPPGGVSVVIPIAGEICSSPQHALLTLSLRQVSNGRAKKKGDLP
jgi:hypothetical protein